MKHARKIKIFAVALTIISMSMALPAYAQTNDMNDDNGNVTYNWGDKLKRGTLNIISSPVEIGRSIYLGTDQESLLYGWTVGLVKGTGNAFVRLGAGIIEVLTFPFDFPTDDKEPLIEPEYVWQKSGPEYA